MIPTVCNLKNMLTKLVDVNGDMAKLKPWEKSSFKAYELEDIKNDLLSVEADEQIQLIRNHILKGNPTRFGANCIDIYLVAYVTENNCVGKDQFFHYMKIMGITDKPNSAQAIWQVGKGDGTIRDWNFVASWIKGSI